VPAVLTTRVHAGDAASGQGQQGGEEGGGARVKAAADVWAGRLPCRAGEEEEGAWADQKKGLRTRLLAPTPCLVWVRAGAREAEKRRQVNGSGRVRGGAK